MVKELKYRGPMQCGPDIIAYESGELDDNEVIDLFQALVDFGLAWQLQGHYGRTAMALIDAGLVTVRNAEVK